MRPQDAGPRPPMEGLAEAPLPFDGGRQAVSDEEIARVRRRALVLYIVAPAISAAALLTGFARGWPALAAGGAIGLGATALVAGLLAMAERRLYFLARGLRMNRTRYVLYEGFAAIPLGFAWAVAGATVVVAAVAFLQGAGPQALRAQVAERPGHALVPAGAFLLANGLGLVIGFSRREGSFGQRLAGWLVELPSRLGGTILVVLGAAALAAGLYEWLRPGEFDLRLAEIARGRLPFGL